MKGCAINYGGLKTEHSTRHCVYAVMCRCQWLCSYILGLISQEVCSKNKECLLIMFKMDVYL